MMAAARSEDQSDALVHPPAPPRRGASRATTWWGKAWVRAVEEAAYNQTELRAARALSRAGRVGGISVASGVVVASVGDDHGLWTPRCAVPALNDEATEALVEVIAAQSGRIGSLAAGDLPHSLVEHAEESGVELLPFGTELEASCTCDAWLDPCVHALAVLYQLTWLLEADPFVLLHVRGLPRDELLARLHARSEAGEADPGGPDDLTVDAAVDAALRAARVLELLDEPERSVDHLL